MSLYSIEFSPQRERQGDSDSNDYDNENLPQPVSPKPMTPRRVKRRSVMQRGSSGRHSTSSRRHNNRSSTRSSRRAVQNPVTRLMEQQQKIQQQQQQQQHYDSPASPVEPQTFFSSASNNNLMVPPQSWQSNGHTNPTYQQSSTQSLNEHDDFDELYNNRPASVRSSYSNFHGTRAINYAQQHYHSHATPQVPQKRLANPGRQSMRSMAFLNNGPPAYSSQGQLGLDSETTI